MPGFRNRQLVSLLSSTRSGAVQPSYLPAQPVDVYLNTDTDEFYKVHKYSNGSDIIYNVKADSASTYTRMTVIPDNFELVIPLVNTLPTPLAHDLFWFQELGDFVITAQHIAAGETLLWEAFINNVGYSTIGNLRIVDQGGNTVDGETLTLESQKQSNGTFNHSITTDTPVDAFNAIRIMGDGVLGTRQGSNDPSNFLNFYTV